MRRRARSPMLAIDTATALTGLALFDYDPISELIWRCDQRQTVELLPAIDWLLARQGWTIDDICAVAVSLGPGSFNGLRVGLGTAKALCFARSLPCLGVSTLDAAALQHSPAERAIRPLYDAGRNEVATALYRAVGTELRRAEEPRLVSLEVLAEQIDVPTLLCGELREEWIDVLRSRHGELISFPPEAGRVRHPAYVAQLGWQRWQGGERDDVVALQPIYLRCPAITASARTVFGPG